jgi:hypothetical protein
MTDLQSRYELAKKKRAQYALGGFVVGTIGGALISQDASMSLLMGLITCVAIAIEKSREVMRLEKIIYPGGK